MKVQIYSQLTRWKNYLHIQPNKVDSFFFSYKKNVFEIVKKVGIIFCISKSFQYLYNTSNFKTVGVFSAGILGIILVYSRKICIRQFHNRLEDRELLKERSYVPIEVDELLEELVKRCTRASLKKLLEERSYRYVTRPLVAARKNFLELLAKTRSKNKISERDYECLQKSAEWMISWAKEEILNLCTQAIEEVTSKQSPTSPFIELFNLSKCKTKFCHIKKGVSESILFDMEEYFFLIKEYEENCVAFEALKAEFKL